jgi:hypothetical protein
MQFCWSGNLASQPSFGSFASHATRFPAIAHGYVVQYLVGTSLIQGMQTDLKVTWPSRHFPALNLHLDEGDDRTLQSWAHPAEPASFPAYQIDVFRNATARGPRGLVPCSSVMQGRLGLRQPIMDCFESSLSASARHRPPGQTSKLVRRELSIVATS